MAIISTRHSGLRRLAVLKMTTTAAVAVVSSIDPVLRCSAFAAPCRIIGTSMPSPRRPFDARRRAPLAPFHFAATATPVQWKTTPHGITNVRNGGDLLTSLRGGAGEDDDAGEREEPSSAAASQSNASDADDGDSDEGGGLHADEGDGGVKGDNDSYEEAGGESSAPAAVVHAEIVLDDDDDDGGTFASPSEMASGISAPSQQDLAASKSRETQHGAYSRSAMLWAAIALDVTLNRKKRGAIFGSPGGEWLSTVGPTASLASGFVLAAGVMYGLSTMIGEDKDELHTEYCKRLNLSLVAFAALNLVFHLIPGASSVQYLGMSAAVIHLHNGLTALNGWIRGVRGVGKQKGKEVRWPRELWEGTKSTVANLGIRGRGPGDDVVGDGGTALVSKSSLGYLAALAAVGVRFVALLAVLLAGKANPIDRSLPLRWAALARLTLLGGVLSTLKDASDRDRLGESIFVQLNAALSATSMAVALSEVLSVAVGNVAVTFNLASRVAVWILMAAVSGYNCASPLVKLLPSR